MRSYLFVMVVFLAAACGDDEGGGKTADAAPTADAPPAADAGPMPDAAGPTACTCLALGVDYVNGVGTAARLELPSLVVTKDVVPGAASGDPVVRYLDGRFFIVNRFGFNNVTIVDPTTWTVTAQFSTGPGSNPQDVAVKGAKAYVVALGRPEVLVFNLANLAQEPATIPLPVTAADADLNPDAVSIAIRGSRAYVAVGHLENFVPVARGQIVVIDMSSDTVETTFDLTDMNPVNFLRERPIADDLVVAVVPDYHPAKGCLESIKTGGSSGSNGCLATSQALGGYVAGIAPGDDGHVYLAVNSSFTEGKVVRVADDGTIDSLVYSAPTQLPTDVAFCGATGQIVANDAQSGGLRVYDAATHTEVTSQALDIGLPPAFASGIACFAH